MRVKAVIGFAGIGFSVAVGEVADLPDAIAESAIRARQAEAIAEPTAKQTTTKANKKVTKK